MTSQGKSTPVHVRAVKALSSPSGKPIALSGLDSPECLLRDIELAALLNISRRFVHTLRARGILRAVRLGTALRFPRNENLARILTDDGNKGGRAP